MEKNVDASNVRPFFAQIDLNFFLEGGEPEQLKFDFYECITAYQIIRIHDVYGSQALAHVMWKQEDVESKVNELNAKEKDSRVSYGYRNITTDPLVFLIEREYDGQRK